MKLFFVLAVLIFTFQLQAHQGLELGIGAGFSKPFAGEGFRNDSSSGNANYYFLGYNYDPNWSALIDVNSFDFDQTNISTDLIALNSKYRWNHTNFYHPFAAIGLGALSTKNFSGDKNSGLGAALGLGLEFDFSWVTLGGQFRWIYADKVIGATPNSSKYENAQALLPMLTASIHWPFDRETSPAKSAAQESVSKALTPVVSDADHDGVSDDEDKCPNTPPGVKVNSIGCSETEKAHIKLEITFEGGKSAIDPKFQGEINKLADFLKKYPTANVEIAGHTDNKGNEKRNTKLSSDRAAAVAEAIAKLGIEKSRITSKGYGPSQPVASNETAEGRAQNRRVVAEINLQVEVKK